MKTYTATVKNKETGKYITISSKYSSKAAFISDLRANGYAVNPKFVSTKEQYEHRVSTYVDEMDYGL